MVSGQSIWLRFQWVQLKPKAQKHWPLAGSLEMNWIPILISHWMKVECINWSQSDYVVVTSLKAVCVAYKIALQTHHFPLAPFSRTDRFNWFIQKCRFHRMRSLFIYSHGSRLDSRSSCLIYLKYFYWQVSCSHSRSSSFSFSFYLLWMVFSRFFVLAYFSLFIRII